MMPIKLVLKKKTILAFVINLAVIEAGLDAVNEKILLRERERERKGWTKNYISFCFQSPQIMVQCEKILNIWLK